MHKTYGRVLAAPGAGGFVIAGFIARLGHYMTVLGIVFLVTANTGSYSLAGATSAGYTFVYAAISPWLSRLVDRHGQAHVLRPAMIANTVARAGFLAAAWAGASGWALVLLAVLTGASMPAIGSLVRARWSELYKSSPLLHTALSFESVVDETILIAAPIVVATLAVYLDPSAGLVVALVLAVAGMMGLAAQRRTEPPLRHVSHARGAALLVAGFPMLLITFGLVAVASTTVELTTVAFSQRHHATATSGAILAAMSLGSALCGLWYGSRQWRRSPELRLVRTSALLAASALSFIAASSITTLFIAAMLYGLTLAPIFIDGFAIVHRIMPPHQRTEGLAWPSTAVAAGMALGSAVAGRAIDAWGTRVAFGSAAGCAALVLLVAGQAMIRTRTAPVSQPAPHHVDAQPSAAVADPAGHVG